MPNKARLLIVDGYNVIGAWPELGRGKPLADARDQLIERLHDYAGYSGQKVVLVFDAWQSDRETRSVEEKGLLTVVFTQKGETADHYIERLCDENERRVSLGRLELRVATSDSTEQTVVFGRGAVRISSRELIYEMGQARRAGQPFARPLSRTGGRSMVMDHLSPEVREKLEKLRRGGKSE